MACFLVNVDLYFILKNPFYPTYKRTIRFWKYILLLSFLYSISFNLLILFPFKDKINAAKFIMKCLVRIILVIGNIIISMKILKRLKREGISNKLIKRVLFNWIGLIIVSTMSFLIYPLRIKKTLDEINYKDYHDEHEIYMKLIFCFVSLA